MRRVVSLFLPNWPTDRLRRQAAAPLEGSRPLLTALRQGSRRLIHAVDPDARALGLHPGMAVAQAMAMAPDLDIAEADPTADEAALCRLAVWCLRCFTPLAAPDPPDGLWLDVSGCAHLFGGEVALSNLLVGRLGRAGIAARAGVADTPGAAHALARHAADPVALAPQGEAGAALDGVPVIALRLPDDAVAGLRRVGFETIGQLMRAPRGPLSRRFGAIVLRRLDQATGNVSEPIEPIASPELPCSRMGFVEPIATADDLARATTLLSESLCRTLLRRGLGARRVDLVFGRVDDAAQAIRIGTAAPTRESAHLVRLLLPHIETVNPGYGIEVVTLTASLTDQLDARQVISVLTGPPEADLCSLVDTLLNRLGPGKVFRVRPIQSDIPERSVQYIPPLSRAAGENWPDRLPRPTRLFDPPKPVEVMALLPDHPPARFTWRRKSYRIRRSDGPERVFGEWWQAPEKTQEDETEVVRDYFQVEDEAGQRFWLFRQSDGKDLPGGDLRWFLHGVFG